MNIFEIDQELFNIALRLQEDPDNPETLKALNEVTENFAIKADSYQYLLKELKAGIDTRKEEIKRLQSKNKSDENVINRLRDNLKICLSHFPDNKFKTTKFTFFNVTRESLVFDEKLIPEEYFTTELVKTLDKELLKLEAAKKEIPGVTKTSTTSAQVR